MRIGRTVRMLEDRKRQELLSDTDEQRKIVISIFYPVDENTEDGARGLYMDLFSPRQEEFIKRFAGVNNPVGQPVGQGYLKSITTNVGDDLPISSKAAAYPVVIYSPGLGMYRDSLIYNIEKLVSSGYIVITMGHLYDADFTILPDGEIIEQAKYIADSTLEEKALLIDIRTKDILFLLDELKNLHHKDEFAKGKLDLDSVGVIGHSLGGMAVFKAAAEDKRIKAVIMLDGSLQFLKLSADIMAGKSLGIPLLNFRRGSIDYEGEMKKAIEFNADKLDGEQFKKRIVARHWVLMAQIEGQRKLYEYLTGYKSSIMLKDSEHLTFTDWPIIHDQKFENGVLSIKEAQKVISEITYRFFDEFLCGVTDAYTSFIGSTCCPGIIVMDKEGK